MVKDIKYPINRSTNSMVITQPGGVIKPSNDAVAMPIITPSFFVIKNFKFLTSAKRIINTKSKNFKKAKKNKAAPNADKTINGSESVHK